MRRIRAYLDMPLTPGQSAPLSPDARAHLHKVLRLRDGDTVTLFNGDGHDYPARLIGTGPNAAADILSREPAVTENAMSITLLQALARGEKMDWIIQKATELGVTRIVPVTTQRSEVRLDAERADRRLAHWLKVAVSACEQCGRARVPTIDSPRPLHAALEGIDAGLRIALDPSGPHRLATLNLSVDSIAVAIGPEGGFDDAEYAQLARCGWLGLSLGSRILRTETAGIVTLSAILALIHEL